MRFIAGLWLFRFNQQPGQEIFMALDVDGTGEIDITEHGGLVPASSYVAPILA